MRKITSALVASLCVSLAAHAQTPAASRAPSVTDVNLYARLMAMTDSRSYDRVLLDSVMSSTWAPLRAAGALAIGQVGAQHGKPGLPLLQSLLADNDLKVASNAAYALGLLHDSTSVSSLYLAIGGPVPVAREAAWALGEIGSPARVSITRALSAPGGDEARMIQLLLAAAKLRPVPVREIRPYLAMASMPSIQWAAAYAIARTREAAGVRDLIALATRPDFIRASATEARGVSSSRAGPALTAEAYVNAASGRQRARAEIARGLAKSAAGDSLADRAIGVLTSLVADAHPHVRINAIRSLGTYGKRARALLVKATADPDANVRITAAQSLGTVLDSALASWTPLWQRDTSLMYRSSLLISATHAGATLPALNDWKTHRDWHYRAAALNAASESVDSLTVLRTATSMLKDADGRVRANAYGLLTGNDTSALPDAIHKTLIAGLADSDFYARATVIGSMSRHAVAADVPAVLASYKLSLADSGNDARIAAIGYLSSAWKRDSANFSADLTNQLRSLPPSDDPLVRAQVDSATVFSSWPSTSGNPRPLSWYQNVVRTYVIPALDGRTQRATIHTRRGDIILELFGADAPITVWNFMNLARTGFYRGTGFHRVVPNFVIQDGDPRDDGNGGPGYSIRDEMNPRRYDRGALGMALSGPDTGGSQYFITHSPQAHLDGHYTVFGRVLLGFAALDGIVQGDRITSIEVQ